MSEETPQVPVQVTAPLAPVPPAPRQPTTLEKISLLSNLASACEDPDVVKILTERASGKRLYEIFVAAVSTEIETIMNGPVQAPQALQNANASAQQLSNILQRLAQVFSAVEHGPGLGVLRMFVQQMGQRLPPIPRDQLPEQPPEQTPRQPEQPRAPAPAAPRVHPSDQPRYVSSDGPVPPQNNGPVEPTRQREGRRGIGTW